MVNPFYTWSGYYPGDKPLKGGGGRYSGYRGNKEYVQLFDVFGTLDADLDYAASRVAGAPQAALEFFLDELKGDVKSALKASGGFSATGSNPTFSADQMSVEAREDWHEKNQLLGTADMKWDLNPFEYWKDPKKHLMKQVKGVWTSFANYEDLDTNYKKQFVDGLVNGISPTGLGAGLAVGAFAARTTHAAPAGTAGDSASALQLAAKPGEYRGFDTVYKIEKKLAPSLEGENFSYTPAQVMADPYLRKHWEESGLAINDYVDNKFQGCKGKIVFEEKVDVFQRAANRVPNYYANSDNNVGRRLQRNGWYKDYLATVDGTFRDLREDPTKWADYLAQARFADPDARQNAVVTIDGLLLKTDVFEAVESLNASLVSVQKDLAQQLSSGFNNSASLTGNLKSFEGEMRRSRMRIERLEQFYRNNGAPELADQFNTFIAPYDNFLTKLESKTVKYRSRATGYKARAEFSLYSEIDARAFSNELSTLQAELIGKDVLKEGIRTELLEDFIANELGNLSSDTAIGMYAVDFEGLRRMGIWNHRIAQQEYIREAYGDLVGHFFGGKILETYVWSGRLKGRIKSYTPAYFVSEFMTKNHYFGLSIDDKALGRYTKGNAGLLFRPMGWLITKSPVTGLFENRFNIDIKDKNGTLLYGVIKATGGDHFKMAKALVKLRRLGRLDDAQIFSLLGSDLSNDAGRAAVVAMFKDMALLEDYSSAKDFLDGLEKFQTWLKTEGAKLGIYKKDGTIDPDKLVVLTKFLDWVEKRGASGFNYIDIARKYAGGLEKLTSVLNRAQSYIGQKLGKWAKPISYVKYAIAEAIADIVAGALEVGSGGTGTAVVGAVRKVVRGLVVWVEDKVIAGGKAFISALKGGFDDIWDINAENMKKAGTYTAYAALGCSLPVMLALLVFMGILSTISPENPTKSAPEGLSYGDVGDIGACGGVAGPCDAGGDPIPPGEFGVGVGCGVGSMGHPIQPTGSSFNNCYHWDGYRPLDLFSPQGMGAPIYAPFDGLAIRMDNPGAGGYTIIFHPENDCLPAVYYAHNQEERVFGPVTAGQPVGTMGMTGSACQPDASGNCTGAPHVHFAASTTGYFYTEPLDICSAQLLLDNVAGNSCDTGAYSYGGVPCCRREFPQRNGCMPALNQ